MARKVFEGITGRIIGITSVIIIFSISICVAVALIFFNRSFENVLENNFKVISENSVRNIRQDLEYYNSLVRILVEDPFIKSVVAEGTLVAAAEGYDKLATDALDALFLGRGNSLQIDTRAVALFRNYIENFAPIQEIFVTNLYGHNVDVSHPTSDFVQSDESWWQNAFKTGMYIEEVEYDQSAKATVFAICAAVPHPETGKPNGVIKVAIDFSDIQQSIQNIFLGESGEAYLVNRDKVAITESRFVKELKTQGVVETSAILELKVDTEGVNKAFAGESDFRYYKNYRGEKVAGYYTPIPGYDWVFLVEQSEKELSQGTYRMLTLIFVVGLGVLFLSMVMVILFSRSLSQPVLLIAQGARRFAEGDILLSGIDKKRLEAVKGRKDELGDTGRAFSELMSYLEDKVGIAEAISRGELFREVSLSGKQDKLGIALQFTMNNLNSILFMVNSAINQVSTGASQVSQTSQSLASGASEQASAIQEISSSINLIARQSQENAAIASEAKDLSGQAVANAENGNRHMAELSVAMMKINSSSDQIQRIIKVIDDIAFQINLLALNANVEAARAGKYGRGFAVVADEVRKLARKSAESVKETRIMVEETISSIEEGKKAADVTAKQLLSIVEGATRVAELVKESAILGREQAFGIDQINSGLDQVGQITQSNTAAAEECSSAAIELAAQAKELRSMIARFKLAEQKDPGQIDRDRLAVLVEKELLRLEGR